MKKIPAELIVGLIIASGVIAGYYGWHSPFCFRC